MASDKQALINDFDTMRSFEADARDFYRRAAQDPLVTDPSMRQHLEEIAEDEQRHVEVVDRIMHIIRNCI